jgi:hypothetical protein
MTKQAQEETKQESNRIKRKGKETISNLKKESQKNIQAAVKLIIKEIEKGA